MDQDYQKKAAADEAEFRAQQREQVSRGIRIELSSEGVLSHDCAALQMP